MLSSRNCFPERTSSAATTRGRLSTFSLAFSQHSQKHMCVFFGGRPVANQSLLLRCCDVPCDVSRLRKKFSPHRLRVSFKTSIQSSPRCNGTSLRATTLQSVLVWM